MLKALRIKFIITNMVIVSIMLGVIFSLMYYSTSLNLERSSIQMMEQVADRPKKGDRFERPGGDILLPYFTVNINRDGIVTEVGGSFDVLTDESELSCILSAVNDTRDRSGVLKSYSLRFARYDTPFGECIVFADITSSQATLRNLLRTFFVIGAIALSAFFGISVFLARISVKPVELAWEQQKQFVADASHELKTPLTVIMTDAELLSTPDCSDDDRRKFSGNIVTMSRQMRGLVESLLELARIDNGSRQVFTDIRLDEVVNQSAMMFEPVFFENNMPFYYNIEANITVSGNADMLRQLTEILLDNAAKYAAEGGETVLTLKREGHRKCILEVADRGDPIPPDDLKNLFKRFYRADKARAMNRSYGLGLSIAKSIVDEHRGTVTAASEDGINRFTVELPAD